MKENSRTNNGRIVGLDYVKVIACFSVLAIHFRLNFQLVVPVAELGVLKSLAMTVVYQLFVTCVPLFLLATGFLMWKKSYTKAYYKNVLSVHSLYVICCVLTIVALSLIANEKPNLREVYTSIILFKTIPYSWYVKMYLPFALLLPLFNIVIDRANRKELLLCILAVVLVSGIPPFINNPYTVRYIYLTDYWTNIYPISYYLIGGYLSKYREVTETLKEKRKSLLLIYSVWVMLGIGINFYNPSNTGMAEGYYGSILVIMQSVALFLLIYSFFKKENKYISYISKLTFSMYLMSYLADQLVYPMFLSIVGSPKFLIPLFPIIVPIVFVSSFLLSNITDWLNKSFWKVADTINIKTVRIWNDKKIK